MISQQPSPGHIFEPLSEAVELRDRDTKVHTPPTIEISTVGKLNLYYRFSFPTVCKDCKDCTYMYTNQASGKHIGNFFLRWVLNFYLDWQIRNCPFWHHRSIQLNLFSCSWLRNSKPGTWGSKIKRGSSEEEAERWVWKWKLERKVKVLNWNKILFWPSVCPMSILLSGCQLAYWPTYSSWLQMNGNF